MFLTCLVMNFLKSGVIQRMVIIKKHLNDHREDAPHFTFQLVGHRHQLVDRRSCSEAICAIRRGYRMRHSHNAVQSSFQHKQHTGCVQLDIRC